MLYEVITLKWGQGAKCIGGEIKVNTLKRAKELKKRGYVVLPDPTHPEIQRAFEDGVITSYSIHYTKLYEPLLPGRLPGVD